MHGLGVRRVQGVGFRGEMFAKVRSWALGRSGHYFKGDRMRLKCERVRVDS